MNDPEETFEVNGKTVKLYHDGEPQSPREWDNLGRMVCWHRRYNLGDEQVKPGDHAHSLEEFEQWLIRDRQTSVILPVYIYDHGSITITARYATYLRYPDKQWDAGQVGFIYATEKVILEIFGGEYVSQEMLEKTAEVLRGEVDTYDQYLTGDVWGFVIEDEAGNHLASCWGFYGLDSAREEAKAAAED